MSDGDFAYFEPLPRYEVLAMRLDHDPCGCPYNILFTCQMCGHERVTNHCPHDRVQNPCPECKWIEPGKRTPMQFLGWNPTPPRG